MRAEAEQSEHGRRLNEHPAERVACHIIRPCFRMHAHLGTLVLSLLQEPHLSHD